MLNHFLIEEAYIDWKNHLKSMHHSIKRVHDSKSLTDLDRERLNSLKLFLKEQTEEQVTDSFLVDNQNDSGFIPDVDVRICFKKSKAFSEWKKSSKFEKKIDILVNYIEDVLKNPQKDLSITTEPQKECAILGDMIEQILSYSNIQYNEIEIENV